MSIKTKIVNKLVNEYFTAFTTDDLLAMFAAATEEKKQEFLDAILKDKTAEAGKIVREALLRLAESKASTEADRIISENTLTDTDLLRLL